MSIPETERRKLTDEERQLIREVYIRRAGYVRWLSKAVLTGLVAGVVLGWLTCLVGSMLLLNPLFWVGLIWGSSITTALDAQQLGASLVKTTLTAPGAFKAEWARRREAARKDQAILVERMKKD
jgi:hypothetical protein